VCVRDLISVLISVCVCVILCMHTVRVCDGLYASEEKLDVYV